MTSVQPSVADDAERDRRWLRRSCWTGCLLAIAAVLFMVGQPLYVRWRLQRHGWEMGDRHLRTWPQEINTRWIAPVTQLTLEQKTIQPGDLELISQFSGLERLTFRYVAIDDSCMQHLANCHSLQALEIPSSPVQEVSLFHLQKLNRLTELQLHATGSKGLLHVTNCHNLASLRIWEGHFTDADLSTLSRLTKLRALSLWSCPVTDEGAKTLADSCRGLTSLELLGDRLTDVAMTHVARIPDLEQLSLSGQPITDEGLRELKTCAKLRRLYVRKSKVTPSGIDDLKLANPKLAVFPW